MVYCWCAGGVAVVVFVVVAVAVSVPVANAGRAGIIAAIYFSVRGRLNNGFFFAKYLAPIFASAKISQITDRSDIVIPDLVADIVV